MAETHLVFWQLWVRSASCRALCRSIQFALRGQRRNTPLIIGTELPAGRDFAETLATALRCGFQPNACFDELRNLRRKRLDSKRVLIKKAVQALKSQNLRGDALKAARGIQIAPLLIQEATLRRKWLRVLRRTVPFPELALAKVWNLRVGTARLPSKRGRRRSAVRDARS